MDDGRWDGMDAKENLPNQREEERTVLRCTGSCMSLVSVLVCLGVLCPIQMRSSSTNADAGREEEEQCLFSSAASIGWMDGHDLCSEKEKFHKKDSRFLVLHTRAHVARRALLRRVTGFFFSMTMIQSQNCYHYALWSQFVMTHLLLESFLVERKNDVPYCRNLEVCEKKQRRMIHSYIHILTSCLKQTKASQSQSQTRLTHRSKAILREIQKNSFF